MLWCQKEEKMLLSSKKLKLVSRVPTKDKLKILEHMQIKLKYEYFNIFLSKCCFDRNKKEYSVDANCSFESFFENLQFLWKPDPSKV